jgi:DDE superfamily endonuclease
MITPYKKGKQVSVMVWTAFSGDLGPIELLVMDWDNQSKGGGYLSRLYIHTLNQGLRDYYQNGMPFMQDNAPIHSTTITTMWLEDNRVALLEWTPFSPDLNPIEHLWKSVKERLLDLNPELTNIE